jgi:hypothetical protein
MALLSEAAWIALTRLYAAGRQGIEYEGGHYAAAGSWATLRALRDHAPPLAREIVRLDPQNQTTHYLMIITDAGVDFYEKHRRLYNAFYPP